MTVLSVVAFSYGENNDFAHNNEDLCRLFVLGRHPQFRRESAACCCWSETLARAFRMKLRPQQKQCVNQTTPATTTTELSLENLQMVSLENLHLEGHTLDDMIDKSWCSVSSRGERIRRRW
jgi:hypothetical protein